MWESSELSEVQWLPRQTKSLEHGICPYQQPIARAEVTGAVVGLQEGGRRQLRYGRGCTNTGRHQPASAV